MGGMFHDRIIKKIPGDPVGRFKKESQGYIDNLENKQKFELQELLERQNKLLANKRFIANLPDKGEKIMKFRAIVLKEIEHRNEVDCAANLLSRLNIASEGKVAMNALEWTGKYDEESCTRKVVELDSDDETDPLKILAQPTGTGVHAKKIITIQTEETSIKPDDIEEIEAFKKENPPETEHIKYIVDLVENPKKDSHREPFKPHKTTKSNVHDPLKEKMRKKDKHWEITAATPPLTVHGAAKTLSLQESLKLQTEQVLKLQEIQAKHAIERLMQQIGSNCIGSVPEDVGNYRTRDKDSDASSSDDEEEHQEVHDDEDYDKAGTVVFTVDSITE
ncbi:uncharacterized protein Polr2M [Venturia canescens]|uniref:uncharacterized protein Polr2M n=1 Tax=Venturia canescens TaxID=32260 RepID=UPI001C9D5D7E|nr:uncharacterized protein LOC122413449 [Venturia canescens]